MTTEVKTLEPTGMLDGAAAHDLKNQVLDVLRQGADGVLLNLAGITFMNSSGIGALVATLKAVREKDKQLYICGLTDQVRMIFELTKMDRVFTLYTDVADFEAKVAAVE
jgi:anti-sigma B factor antagonist